MCTCELCEEQDPDVFDKYPQFDNLFCLYTCLETAAGLTAVARLSYQKGFDDGTLLRKFCDDTPLAPYFPTADTRPMAERLGWAHTVTPAGETSTSVYVPPAQETLEP